MKTYALREVFDTIQGEAARAGQRSIFVRFAGCNLWDGVPAHRDRGKGACAKWCDTDFARGEKHTAAQLIAKLDELWPRGDEPRWLVLTGGEPGLQLDLELVDALRLAHCRIAVETNATIDSEALRSCSWVTASPKLGGEFVLSRFDELKVVLPGAADEADGWTIRQLLELEQRALDCGALIYVQPQDAMLDPTVLELTALKSKPTHRGAEAAREVYDRNVRTCVDWVMRHPRWRLSLQTHKFAGLA